MYLKKEIIISFFIITIFATNIYMPMIWLNVFLLDFLIPFLFDPDCSVRPQGPLIRVCGMSINAYFHGGFNETIGGRVRLLRPETSLI
jgi:hypothetical protein